MGFIDGICIGIMFILTIQEIIEAIITISSKKGEIFELKERVEELEEIVEKIQIKENYKIN